MKTAYSFLTFVLAACCLVPGAPAQTTAFLYQGRLTDGGTAANGTYDLKFALTDALTDGNQVGPPVINSAVAVSDGIFTVTLDFGSSPFSGAARWLEIGVRTNGSAGSFTTLAPRQPVLPTPYGIYSYSAATAASANSVAAANITGTVSLNQLPAPVLTNNQSGVVLSGTFVGNGAGLTNVAGGGGGAGLVWQAVSGTTVQAVANSGYLTTADGQTTLTLPAVATVGDVVRVAGTGSGGWKIAQNSGQSVLISSSLYSAATNYTWVPRTNAPVPVGYGTFAISAGGAKMYSLGAGQTSTVCYASADFGATWSVRGSFAPYPGAFVDAAASADGTKLVAVPANSDQPIYTSTDSGSNWTAQISAQYWGKVASSADGTKMFAASYTFSFGVADSSIWVSTNSGGNWQSNHFVFNSVCSALASSADGTRLAAGDSYANIFTSSDSGATWNQTSFLPNTPPGVSLAGLASSADGTRLVALQSFGLIYTSTNSGTNWTARAGPLNRNWRAVASSVDGTRLVAGSAYGASGPDAAIFTSIDSGVTWTQSLLIGAVDWNVVKLSADGTVALIANQNFGLLYNGTVLSTAPGTQGYLTGNQYSAVELLYTGGGRFLPVSYVGSITPH